MWGDNLLARRVVKAFGTVFEPFVAMFFQRQSDEWCYKNFANFIIIVFWLFSQSSEVSCQTVYLPSLAGDVCDMNLNTGKTLLTHKLGI